MKVCVQHSLTCIRVLMCMSKSQCGVCLVSCPKWQLILNVSAKSYDIGIFQGRNMLVESIMYPFQIG